MNKLVATTALIALLGAGLAIPGAVIMARTPVNQEAACLPCHDDIAARIGSSFQHAPAAGGECTACHNAHVSRHGSLLKSHQGMVCASCHDELQEQLKRKIIHEPVAAGQCASCHDPHGAKNKHLLKLGGKELCQSCHADIAAWSKRPVMHAPFARGQCSTCHQSHGADHEGLLVDAEGVTCAKCHSFDDPFRVAHGGFPVEKGRCTSCHDPHASGKKGLVRVNLHSPFEDGDCKVCHVGPGSTVPFALNQPMEQLCNGCHEDLLDEWRGKPFTHVSEVGNLCTGCHNPHAAPREKLLKGSPKQFCLDCHDPGGAKSGLPGRYLTHGKNLQCTECHYPMGSHQMSMVVVDTVELCKRCHEDQHKVSHAVGAGRRDPRNGMPLTCVSCHSMHDAPYPKYMVGDPERGLCLDCHKDIEGG